jgi:hypothetical protein
MIDAMTVASYDLASQLLTPRELDSPSISAQTQRKEQAVAVHLALVPVPDIVEERHLVTLVLLPPFQSPLLGQGRSDGLGREGV